MYVFDRSAGGSAVIVIFHFFPTHFVSTGHICLKSNHFLHHTHLTNPVNVWDRAFHPLVLDFYLQQGFFFSALSTTQRSQASFAALQAEECTRMRRDSWYCHERVSKTDTEEKKYLNKLFIFDFFADK